MTARRHGWPALVTVTVGALCVPTAVAGAVLSIKASDASSRNSARAGALHAAAHIAQDLLSYDYRTIGQDVNRARAETTGSFAQQYAAAAADLRNQAVATHAIVQARVRDTGIVSAGRDRAVVLVFADQISVTRASASAVPATRLIPSAVQMTLTLAGGRWRVADLTAVQTGEPGSGAG